MGDVWHFDDDAWGTEPKTCNPAFECSEYSSVSPSIGDEEIGAALGLGWLDFHEEERTFRNNGCVPLCFWAQVRTVPQLTNFGPDMQFAFRLNGSANNQVAWAGGPDDILDTFGFDNDNIDDKEYLANFACGHLAPGDEITIGARTQYRVLSHTPDANQRFRTNGTFIKVKWMRGKEGIEALEVLA